MLRCVALCCIVLFSSQCCRFPKDCHVQVYRTVMQYVAVFCSVLQCVAVRCSLLQCAGPLAVLQLSQGLSCPGVLQCDAACVVCCRVLQHVLQCVAVRCSALQCVAACCSVISANTVDVSRGFTWRIEWVPDDFVSFFPF